MTTKTKTEPVLYAIWWRAGKGHRWKRAGRASTHAEAVTLIGGPGDWHIEAVYEPEPSAAQRGLFDAEPEAE